MKKLGVIVNPIAGMGGKVGLKGSDGPQILRKAKEMGARPEAPARAVQTLELVSPLKDRIQVITCPSDMGENECREAGLSPLVIGSIREGATTPEDTRRAARHMAAMGVDLLLFAGGDGTARDIYLGVRHKIPALGIPAGVKIHSAVYAVTPRSAGHVAVMFMEGRLTRNRVSEVMDIDEEAFRRGRVWAKLYGTLRVPEERRCVQTAKSGGMHSERDALNGIAADVIETMEEDIPYLIGPGTTTRAVKAALGIDYTLLGVDVVRNKRLMAGDVNERQLLDLIAAQGAKIVVTAIGGQGHIFGRGNQQLSPAVLRRVGRGHIIVIATKEKLASLRGKPLLVDTGDDELDLSLSGYLRVTTGYSNYVMYKVGYELPPQGRGEG